MPKRTKSYRSWLLQRLGDQSRAERYLKHAIEDSPQMFLKALRNVAEARGMSRVAEIAGLNRESLYRALSEKGNPEYGTLNSLLDALGVKLTVEPKVAPVPPPAASSSTTQAENTAATSRTSGIRNCAHTWTYRGNVASDASAVHVGLLIGQMPEKQEAA